MTAVGQWLGRIATVVGEETKGLDARLLLLRLAHRVAPGLSPLGNAALLRRLGCRLGPGTRVTELPRLTGSTNPCPRLTTGADCVIGADVVLDLEDRLELGDRVTLGDRVMILTSTHELGPKEHRAGRLQTGAVVIESGAVIGDGAILFPNVKVGASAVVEPGAVVSRTVAAATRVRGNPAVPVPTAAPLDAQPPEKKQD